MSLRDTFIKDLAGAWSTLDDTGKTSQLQKLLGVSLIHADHSTGRSRLGGTTMRMKSFTPYEQEPLTDGDPWSRVVGNRPLVASIDLTEASAVDGYPAELPSEGMLYVFYDPDRPYNPDEPADAGFTSLLVADDTETVELIAPEGVHVWPVLALSPVQHATAVRDKISARTGEIDLEDLIHQSVRMTGHQLGGLPSAIQRDPAFEMLYHGDYAPLLEEAQRVWDRQEFAYRLDLDRISAATGSSGGSDADAERKSARSERRRMIRNAIIADIEEETASWGHFLTIVTDERAGMMWGDDGTLYLLHRSLSRGVERRLAMQCY